MNADHYRNVTCIQTLFKSLQVEKNNDLKYEPQIKRHKTNFELIHVNTGYFFIPVTSRHQQKGKELKGFKHSNSPKPIISQPSSTEQPSQNMF